MNYLLTFQLGPVQDFIAAAKTTRDLWSGSYMLSYLMASTICAIKVPDVEVIFPSTDSSVLKILEVARGSSIGTSDVDNDGYLLPTLPNKLLIKLKCDSFDDVKKIAAYLERVPRETLTKIGESVKGKFQQAIDTERFDAQLNTFFEIYWAAVEIEGEDISQAYKKLNKIAGAAKNLRFFSARNRSWSSGKSGAGWKSFQHNEKDFLSGRDENVIVSNNKFHALDSYTSVLIRENESLGAINLLKRLWHLTYLQGEKGLPKKWFEMPCTYDIAMGKIDKDSSEDEFVSMPYGYEVSSSSKQFAQECDFSEKYYAVLAFDGDKIGKWVSGEMLKERDSSFTLDEPYLKEFSNKLNQFTRKAKEIIASHKGRLIYSGGDDVLALLPSEYSIKCARTLNLEFGKFKFGDVAFESSCGIAVGHIKIPLQDVVKQAQLSEKDAKNVYGRNALSIHILKRSGEIVKWGSKFDNLENFELLNTLIFRANNSDAANDISEKFLYDFMKVLYKYVPNGTSSKPILNTLEKTMILESELESTMESKPIPKVVKEKLRKSLASVIHDLQSPSGNCAKNHDIETLISLFQVAAWTEAKLP